MWGLPVPGSVQAQVDDPCSRDPAVQVDRPRAGGKGQTHKQSQQHVTLALQFLKVLGWGFLGGKLATWKNMRKEKRYQRATREG